MVAIGQVALGFVLLFGGGEFLVRGAVGLSQRLGVSPLLVGATVVAFGTSAPELAVCVRASESGYPALALGTIIGSNIANALLILGVAALVSPVLWQPLAVRRDATLLVGTSLLFVGLTGGGGLTSLEGGLMVLCLLAITAFSFWYERQDPPLTVELLNREAREIGKRPPSLPVLLLTTLGGIAAIVLGADQLVVGAAEVARACGVSEAAIGMTLVAVGTSLPELATSVMAAYRQHADVALGNVLGSNVFNQLGIGGAAALVAPLRVPGETLHVDLWLMLAVMVTLGAVLVVRCRLGRRAGLLCLLVYALWVGNKW